VESVAQQLGNTPTICRRSYVHPAVIDAYLDGTVLLADRARQTNNGFRRLRPEEAAVLGLIQHRLNREDTFRAA